MATFSPDIHPADYPGRHSFSDHQHCLKCGKSETAPDAYDCIMTDREYEAMIRRGDEPAWRIASRLKASQ